MTTTNQTSETPKLALELPGNGLLEIDKWANHCIDEFWRRKLEHIKAFLDWQEQQRAKLASVGGSGKSINRYLDNADYFGAMAARIEDGYNSWLERTLKSKPELAEEMNLYLNNNCPNPLVKARHDIPEGFLKFMMMMITKISALRTLFQEFAPEATNGLNASETRLRKYDFSSSVFFNVIELLASVWGESVHAQMAEALSESRPERVVAALEETVLLYDEVRTFAGRIRLLRRIAGTEALPRFEDVKKADTLFKAFAYDQLQELKGRLSANDYRQAVEELRRQFAERWNRHAALLGEHCDSAQLALKLDDMMVDVQDGLVAQGLKEAVYSKNQRYGEGMRGLRQRIREASQRLADVSEDEKSTGEEVKLAASELADAQEKIAVQCTTMVSIDETDEDGRSLGDTLASADANEELETPEDLTQDIWDELNGAQKAYLVLTSELSDCANSKDGMHMAFADAAGVSDVRNLVVNNIIRIIVQTFTEEQIVPFNTHNYRALFAQVTDTVRQNGLESDLKVTLGMLISQSGALLESDAKRQGNANDVNEIMDIVDKVKSAMQRRKFK